MAWQKNGTPDTLTGSGDQIDINDLTKLQFNQYFLHVFATGGAINIKLRHGSGTTDTGTNYAHRWSINGVADPTPITSNSEVNLAQHADNVIASGESSFVIVEIINIAGEEKLAILHEVGSEAIGVNAPHRSEFVYKWDDTTNQFDIIETNNGAGGSYDTDSNLSALGTD